MTVEIRRGTARFESRSHGLLTRHSFSFGDRYDPDNLAFGPLVCHDDHLLGAGRGFEAHQHADVDIVTWVVTGALRSEPGGVLEPGAVAVTHAGDGITHSEVAEAPGTRFVQAWLRSSGGTPSREVRPVSPGSDLTVACKLPGGTLSIARLAPGESVTLSEGPLQHVYVVTGALARSSLAEPLAAGDAFRITDQPQDRPGFVLTAAAPTELMVWDLAR